MKKTAVLCAVAIWMGMALPQTLAQSSTGADKSQSAEVSVPASVTQDLKTRYPQASGIRWKKTKKGKYEATFQQGGKKTQAKFTSDGQWESTETRLSQGELPAAASQYLKEHYAAYPVDKVTYQEDADGKKSYEVKLKNAGNEVEAKFDGEGKFLKMKEKKEDKQ